MGVVSGYYGGWVDEILMRFTDLTSSLPFMPMALLEDPTGGEMVFDGESYEHYQDGNLTEFRRNVQIIFQDPFDSLNPRQTVRKLVGEPLTIHDYLFSRRESRRLRRA